MQRIDSELVFTSLVGAALLTIMGPPLIGLLIIIANIHDLDLHVEKVEKVEAVEAVDQAVEVECKNVWDSVPHPEFCDPGDKLGVECMIATRVIIGKECK